MSNRDIPTQGPCRSVAVLDLRCHLKFSLQLMVGDIFLLLHLAHEHKVPPTASGQTEYRDVFDVTKRASRCSVDRHAVESHCIA